MKRFLKKYWIVLIVLLALLICYCPLPVRRELSGLSYVYGQEGAGEVCTLRLKGVVHRYLFRPDVYYGDFELSDDPRTEGITLATSMSREMTSSLIHYKVDGTPAVLKGYFVAPQTFSWTYVRIAAEDGTVREIIFPAETEKEADAVRQKAQNRLWEHFLPDV